MKNSLISLREIRASIIENKFYAKEFVYNDKRLKFLNITKQDITGFGYDRTSSELWFKNGEYHRDDDEPAIIRTSGKWWYKNGLQHRKNAPAVILSDGTKAWYLNGVRHRIGYPAIISKNKSWYTFLKEGWYENGFAHRENGAALIYQDEVRKWYLNGTQYTKAEYYKAIKAL